jgi:integrase
MNSVDESVMDKDQLPKTPRCTAARWAERENPLKRPPRRTKLTQLAVDQLKAPRTGRYIVWDKEMPGFGVRLYAAQRGRPSRKTYIVTYRVHGESVMQAVADCASTKLGEAKEKAGQIRQKARDGIDPRTESGQRPAPARDGGDKFGTVAERYFSEYADQRLQPQTLGVRRSLFKCHLLPAWEKRRVCDIGREDIKLLLKNAGNSHSAGHANNIHTAIKSFFYWLVYEDDRKLLTTDPTIRVKPPRERSERERLLTDDEICLFWRACDQEGYPHGWLYQLLLLTGQRPGEIQKLKRSDLDLQNRELSIPLWRTKSRRGHIVPISDFAAEIFQKVCAVSDPVFLFSARTGPSVAKRNAIRGFIGLESADISSGRPITKQNAPRRRVAALMRQYQSQEVIDEGRRASDAIIEPWQLRDLRRTAATIMARRGHALEVVDKILNHAAGHSGTGRTVNIVTRIYVKHEFLDERRNALEDLGCFIRDLVRK